MDSCSQLPMFRLPQVRSSFSLYEKTGQNGPLALYTSSKGVRYLFSLVTGTRHTPQTTHKLLKASHLAWGLGREELKLSTQACGFTSM